LYDKKSNLLVTRMQPGREQDQAFCGFTQEDINMLGSWLPSEASTTVKHLRQMKEEESWGLSGGWTLHANQHAYWNVA
jgi:hypothetical protein